MKRLNSLTPLLCSLSWIFISGSGHETVEVSQGEDVTLACSNISKEQSQTVWYRLANRIKPSAIASMFSPTKEALNCPGFDKSQFKMTSNISTLFVHIKRADLSDSGLYFCGTYSNKCIEFSTVTFLNVTQFQDKEDDKLNDPNESHNQCIDRSPNLNIIWSGLCVLLIIIIIVLAFKIKNLKSAVSNVPQQEAIKDLALDDLNYAALTFRPKPKRSLTSASKSEQEPSVIYAATR